jgi:hypothetical protein
MRLRIEIIPALPPLSTPRLCDMRLSIDRWLVLAYSELPEGTQGSKERRGRR